MSGFFVYRPGRIRSRFDEFLRLIETSPWACVHVIATARGQTALRSQRAGLIDVVDNKVTLSSH